MNNQLLSISKIFTEKLFRIPDYQRGYAWGLKQLKDYWNDIIQLENGQNHYVGVLTLESVPKKIWANWQEDRWIIDSKNYEPLYVVDGQQRLTTTIILLQAITEKIKGAENLNYTSREKIKEKFIFDTKDGGISRSYIFGYEKDNPSYEYLKRKIFLEDSDGYRDEETIYTQNLQMAKQFFINNIEKLTKVELEDIYKKITQNLLFNIYTISNDIDVFVAFETMNNRGKPLSNLELLKNRLIYLSTKFDAEINEKNHLRKKINDTWKAIYHYLGKNKDRPLNDDFFLLNHFIITFGKTITEEEKKAYRNFHYGSLRDIYEKHLLEKKFTIKSIRNEDSTKLTILDINDYINSLQESVKIWFNIFNPTQCKIFEDDEKLYLDKLYRLNPSSYSTLLLLLYISNPTKKIRMKFLRLLEKYEFISEMTFRYSYDIDYDLLAIELTKSKPYKFDSIIKVLEQTISKIENSNEFIDSLVERFRSSGFYNWRQIKYFLFEYELSLKEKTKTKREKIVWDQYAKEYDEFITIEHIYPQNPKDPSWLTSFNFHHKQNRKLCNSLGNLLALSKPKNSSLQNNPFSTKVDNGKNKVGYRYGSYSENEVAKNTSWTPMDVLNRGVQLLKFLENRWDFQLGDEQKKIEILGLSFLKNTKVSQSKT